MRCACHCWATTPSAAIRAANPTSSDVHAASIAAAAATRDQFGASPVVADVGDHAFDHAQIDRLDQVVVEAGLLRAQLVARLAVAGDRHQPDPRQPRLVPDAAGQLVAVHQRQPDVEQRDVGGERLQLCQRLRPVVGDLDRVAEIDRAPPRATPPRPRCRRRPARAGPRAPAACPGSTDDRRGRIAPSPVTSSSPASVTTNSLPLPGPLLCASTVPSCSVTSDLTMLSPRPRPPSDRSRPWRPCTNRSNTTGSISRRMPMPVSLTATRSISALALGGDGDRAAGRRVLGGVGQQVREHLREPRLVAVEDQARLRRRPSGGASAAPAAGSPARSPARSSRPGRRSTGRARSCRA